MAGKINTNMNAACIKYS